jgi:hypothetical protein
MGFYIETAGFNYKAKAISEKYAGKISTYDEAFLAVRDPNIGVVVILNNGFFEAAGFAFDEKEFKAFTSDNRPKQYVLLDREVAELASGYKRKEAAGVAK